MLNSDQEPDRQNIDWYYLREGLQCYCSIHIRRYKKQRIVYLQVPDYLNTNHYLQCYPQLTTTSAGYKD